MPVHWNISVLAVPGDGFIKSWWNYQLWTCRDAGLLSVWEVAKANIQVMTSVLKASPCPTYKYHSMDSKQTSKTTPISLCSVHLTPVAALSRRKNFTKFNKFMGRTIVQTQVIDISHLSSPPSLVFMLNSFSPFSLEILMFVSAIPMLITCKPKMWLSPTGKLVDEDLFVLFPVNSTARPLVKKLSYWLYSNWKKYSGVCISYLSCLDGST